MRPETVHGFFIKAVLSRVHRIHNYVHPELGVILGQEAFVPEIVIPFAAVVFIAVKYCNAAINGNSFQIVMNKIITPTV